MGCEIGGNYYLHHPFILYNRSFSLHIEWVFISFSVTKTTFGKRNQPPLPPCSENHINHRFFKCKEDQLQSTILPESPLFSLKRDTCDPCQLWLSVDGLSFSDSIAGEHVL
ncbi:hypothetical protein L1887_23239 [Cichorium endivia]|nr:hypothetical protein L1887_23239 [Cichorium endivia]